MMKQHKLIGVWSLISSQRFDTNGTELEDSLAGSEGLIIYSLSGMMSANIIAKTFKMAKPEYKTYPIQPPFDSIPMAVAMASLQNYLSYYGKYQINDIKGMVHHDINASNLPHYIGQQLNRHFSFPAKNKLILTTQPLEVNSPNKFYRTLLWERIE